ncbi:hypothetical protein Fmac_010881 [Flemingia macrophylla]|uniref:NB-ARC domain-containing protein n=1 Tax=Flemingia macrophylla TaxID=520843 RepID=A0ABD1MKU4_9FABA
MKKDGTKDQTLYVTQVRDHWKEKLCLVVLDNVSNREEFDKLQEILSRSGMINGSRIVLTTRFKNVALHANRSSTPPHQIRLLTKEESWELFKKVTGNEKTKLEPRVEKLARKVVGRCGGLPLAISSIGCVVRAKSMTQKTLSWVLKQVNHGHYTTMWLRAWDENKRELCETMTKCLYYFTLFPMNFEIPARRIVNLWVAEGVVKENNQQTAEDIAERCIEHLRDCNMIQAVAPKSNKIKTCQLPTMLREIILGDSDRSSRSQYSGTHLERENLKNLKLAVQLLTETEKETLRLGSFDDIGNPEKLILYNMSKMENLSSLRLFGILHMSRLPQNLTDLTLSKSKLSDDSMPELQSLPKLKSLCFCADSYTGRRMVCTPGSFPQLQVLRFWNSRDLQEWDVKEGAMPGLMEFEARSCGNLAFPTGLKHLKTLSLI